MKKVIVALIAITCIFSLGLAVSASQDMTTIYNFDNFSHFSTYNYFVFGDDMQNVMDYVDTHTLAELETKTEEYWETDSFESADVYGNDVKGITFDGNPARNNLATFYCLGFELGQLEQVLDTTTATYKISYAKLDFYANNFAPEYIRFSIRPNTDGSAGKVQMQSSYFKTDTYSKKDNSLGFIIGSFNTISNATIYGNLGEPLSSATLYVDFIFNEYVPTQHYDTYSVSFTKTSFAQLVWYVDYWEGVDDDDLTNQYVPPEFTNPVYNQPNGNANQDLNEYTNEIGFEVNKLNQSLQSLNAYLGTMPSQLVTACGGIVSVYETLVNRCPIILTMIQISLAIGMPAFIIGSGVVAVARRWSRSG